MRVSFLTKSLTSTLIELRAIAYTIGWIGCLCKLMLMLLATILRCKISSSVARQELSHFTAELRRASPLVHSPHCHPLLSAGVGKVADTAARGLPSRGLRRADGSCPRDGGAYCANPCSAHQICSAARQLLWLAIWRSEISTNRRCKLSRAACTLLVADSNLLLCAYAEMVATRGRSYGVDTQPEGRSPRWSHRYTRCRAHVRCGLDSWSGVETM